MDKLKVFPGAHPHKKFGAYPQLWIVEEGSFGCVSGKKGEGLKGQATQTNDRFVYSLQWNKTSGNAEHNNAGIEQAAVVNAHKSPIAPDRVRTYNAVDQLMAVRAKDCAHHRPFGRELCSVAALNGLGEFTLDEGQIFVDRRIGKGKTNA